MPRCDLCFKEKAGLQPPLPKCEAKVCKGCFYDVDRIVGFLEHYGVTFIQQAFFPIQKTTKSKKKGLKHSEGTGTPKTG